MYLLTQPPQHTTPLLPSGSATLGAPPSPQLQALGQALWREAPNGVNVAISYPDRTQIDECTRWAQRERAIGPRGGSGALAFGLPTPDGDLATRLSQLSQQLAAAVAAVSPPPNSTPTAGKGPSLIRTLALFTHGLPSFVSVGGMIDLNNAAQVIKRIAPSLCVDVKVILYGCSAARGQKETGDWPETTTGSGGADSLAAKLRDALVDEGKSEAQVWGHTEVGGPSRNPSLRFFLASSGKGSDGLSYCSDYVFVFIEIRTHSAIASHIQRLGYDIPPVQERALRDAAWNASRPFHYACWLKSVVLPATTPGGDMPTHLTLRGGTLPEMAPLYPLEVATIVRPRWPATFTDARLDEVCKRIIWQLKLPAAPRRPQAPAPVRSAPFP